MNVDSLIGELIALISDLGKDRGSIGPSVYDTAQSMRFLGPGDAASVDWLLSEQSDDGGWGDQHSPYARAVSTVAAILAINSFGKQYRTEIDRGLAFMADQSEIWENLRVDDFTVALEIILPRLVADANRMGLFIDPLPYVEVDKLGRKKLAMIERLPKEIIGTALHSWEAWGGYPDDQLVGLYGGVGNSPAATAAWLGKSTTENSYEARRLCREALDGAARSTWTGSRFIYPSLWPLEGYETAYGLFFVIESGLAHIDGVKAAMIPQVETMRASLIRDKGISFGGGFMPDGDDTAAITAVLAEYGYPVDLSYLNAFERGGHYFSFPFELNASPLTNAHALYALSSVSRPTDDVKAYLFSTQMPDGSWKSDKWHTSWIYMTAEAIIALDKSCNDYMARRAADCLMKYQREDGGWGQRGSTRAETASALLALRLMGGDAASAVYAGYAYLRDQYKPNNFAPERLWIGKDTYAQYRLDRICELCALIAVTLDREEL